VTWGDTVAVMLPNCAELVTTMFAAWYLGAALTPVNPALTDDEVRYQLQDSTCVLVVGDERAQGLAGAVRARYLAAATIFGEEPAQPAVPVAARAGSGEQRQVRAEDVALIIYTSGTTGRPKGVLLDHANLAAMTTSIIDTLVLGPADTSLVVLPLFHVNGLVVSVLSTLLAGGDLVIAPRFEAETFWDLVETYRPTFFSAVPTIYALLEARTHREVDTSSLRFVICGAAPMPPDLITRFERHFGVCLLEGYGLSEATVASTLNPLAGPRRPGTVGVALPGQQVAVIAPDGHLLPAGERRDAWVSRAARGHRHRDPRRLAAYRRRGLPRSRRVSRAGRPSERHDHPWW
jgi:long-chain acyl-CoA synthetase